jgi:reverse gyrase
MQKLSGLVLDYYDDPKGEVLRVEAAEGLAKTAHVLTDDERNRLPDDVYALVAINGTASMRKFAMADEGNTRLSIEYFLQTAGKLPVEAQKTAARNLLLGCEWFSIVPPEALQKIAFGIGTALNVALTAPGAIKETKNNLRAVKGTGGAIMSPQDIKLRRAQMGT